LHLFKMYLYVCITKVIKNNLKMQTLTETDIAKIVQGVAQAIKPSTDGLYPSKAKMARMIGRDVRTVEAMMGRGEVGVTVNGFYYLIKK
jgi:hypothetical protein